MCRRPLQDKTERLGAGQGPGLGLGLLSPPGHVLQWISMEP